MDNGRLAINDSGIDTLVRELDIKSGIIDEKIANDARRESQHGPSYDLDAYEKYDIFGSGSKK